MLVRLFDEAGEGVPGVVHFIIAGDAGDSECIEEECLGAQVTAVQHYVQFIHRCYLVIMRIANTEAGHREVSVQLNSRDVIQTAIHAHRAVEQRAETGDIEIVLNQRQCYIGMHVIEVEFDGIAVRLHLIPGDDTYPTARRQRKFESCVRLRVIEIKTGYAKRDILQFPLFVAD